MKKKLFNLIITLIAGFAIYYLTLPAINFTSPSFYSFLITLIIIYSVLDMGHTFVDIVKIRGYKPKLQFKIIFIVPIILILISVINFIASPIFNSKSYSNRIVIDSSGDFAKDIQEVDFNRVPLLDKDSSQKLGDRVMGEMSDLVSQYYVSNIYTQINFKDDIVRVTPLEYADFIKYLANKKDGIKGYITVNSVTGKSEIIRLNDGMKYVPSAYFSKDMNRHLRFKYPTKIFDDYSFEIDDEGNPYFIIPTIKYTAIGLKKDISGIIVLNPITGETIEYKVGDIPNWIDHVYDADLIIEQTDDWGMYKDGYLNSIFAQKNVTNTTYGYNYLALDGDIYLYTGITSIQSDESNLGFILSNLRTKETIFYSMPGAEEYSAMASAEGLVQEMKYKSTFPLLVNLNGRATYIVSLKDDAGLVKKYAFIDVQDYQKVSVSDVSLGIEKASEVYLNSFELNNNNETLSKTIEIANIKTAIIDGNTVYYIMDKDHHKYSANITVAKNILPFLTIGDKIDVSFVESEINIIKHVKLY